MAETRVVLGWLLAGLTAFAGAACACEVSAPGDPQVPHAHHAPSSDAGHCVQADDCAECGPAISASDRQIGPTLTAPPPPDDALVVDAFAQVAPPRYREPNHHPPPRLPLRAADTAVHRFDILLN